MLHITKPSLFKYIENFTTEKAISFQVNMGSLYSLESPWRGGLNEYTQPMYFLANLEK